MSKHVHIPGLTRIFLIFPDPPPTGDAGLALLATIAAGATLSKYTTTLTQPFVRVKCLLHVS